MKWIFIALLLIAACAYEEEQEQVDPEPDLYELQKQETSMKRTACLIISRYHSNSHKEIIEEVMGSLAPQDQSKYAMKLYAVAIERCLPLISIEQAQQFFIKNNNFDPTQMFYLLDGFDYPEVANQLDELTPNQKNLVKFIKKFDEEMEVRRQQQQAQDLDGKQGDPENEFSIFGMSVKDFKGTSGLVYILILGTIITATLCWAFSNLNGSTVPKDKSKKNKNKHKNRRE